MFYLYWGQFEVNLHHFCNMFLKRASSLLGDAKVMNSPNHTWWTPSHSPRPGCHHCVDDTGLPLYAQPDPASCPSDLGESLIGSSRMMTSLRSEYTVTIKLDCMVILPMTACFDLQLIKTTLEATLCSQRTIPACSRLYKQADP